MQLNIQGGHDVRYRTQLTKNTPAACKEPELQEKEGLERSQDINRPKGNSGFHI